jgi:hypothetical protein
MGLDIGGWVRSPLALPCNLSAAELGLLIPGHRDHRSGDRDKLITITTESLITIVRNPDHDRFGTVITIARNR